MAWRCAVLCLEQALMVMVQHVKAKPVGKVNKPEQNVCNYPTNATFTAGLAMRSTQYNILALELSE